MQEIYSVMFGILEEMGYLVLEKEEDDFSISDYIIDSMQFIDFIVRIEEKLSIELPDDFLDYTLLISAIGFVNKLYSIFENVD